MKKTFFSLAMIAASAISVSASASDGEVKFTGKITDQACTVDTGSQNKEVNMGTISRSAFSIAGSTAAPKKFTLVLTGCPTAVSSAKVRFDGTQVSGNNSILALTTSSDMAKGVGIQIFDSQNKVVPLYEDSSDYSLISTGPNNLDFSARYISLTDAVTPGKADAVTQFTIVYP